MSRFAPFRLLMMLVALAALLASCGSDEPEPTIDPGTPVEVVETWLAALDTQNLEDLAASTSPHSLAVILGAENPLSNAQLYAIAETGLPGPTATSYWGTFGQSFVTFLGNDIGAIEVAASEEFTIDDRRFAVVELSQGGGTAEMVTTLDDGLWVIDLVATSGGPLAAQITTLMTSVSGETEAGSAEIAGALITGTRISLQAALDRDSTNRSLQLEVDALQALPLPSP